MKRAYNIKRNGIKLSTVGGNKAGQFSGGTSRKPRKRLRTQPKGSQRGIKMLFACSLIPMTALFCTGYRETKEKMETPAIPAVEAVEELPPSPKLEELSVVVTPEEATTEATTDLFDKYFGDIGKADIIREICQTESGMQDIRSHKINRDGTYDWGRCQINEIHAWRVGGDTSKLLDPDTNVRVAREVYNARLTWDTDGFNAWSVYK